MNKMDKLPLKKAEARINSYWKLLPGYADSIPTSALEETNLDLLQEHLLEFLPEGPRYYPGDQITDQTEHDIAAELIREAMLRFTHQEVPHSVAVVVEDFEERSEDLIYIGANVFVERNSQKGIIIGKRGAMLQKIGSAAREQIERMTGTKVYLDLWVKVSEDWRRDARRLRELGYRR